jgi:aerobic carbon-monoxide dehydrogenase medium subunit
VGAYLPPFELHRPRMLHAACERLAELGEDAEVYAGGTELLLLMRAGFARPRHLVDVKRVAELEGIRRAGDELVIGAAIPHAGVERDPQVRDLLPALAEAEHEVGNVRVRATGTLVGNLCFADPHGDPAAILLAHGARVVVRSVRGARALTLDDFLLGALETARVHDEIVTAVHVPLLPEHGAAYARIALTERPIVTTAAVVRAGRHALEDARIVVGATGPRPVRLADAEAAANALALDVPDAELSAVGRLASREAPARPDQHGPEDYKRHLVNVLVTRALRRARQRALARAKP